MKKYFIFILIALAIFGCDQGKKRMEFDHAKSFKNIKHVFARLFLGTDDFHFPVTLNASDHGNGYHSGCGAKGTYPDGKPSGTLPEKAVCYAPYHGEESRVFYIAHGLTHILVESYTNVDGVYDTDMGEGFCNLLAYITCYAIGDSAGCRYGEKYLKDRRRNDYTLGMRKATLASWLDIFKRGGTKTLIDTRIDGTCQSTKEDEKKFATFAKKAKDEDWIVMAKEVAEAFMTQQPSKIFLRNRGFTFQLRFPKLNFSILFLLLLLIAIKGLMSRSIKDHK